MASKNFVVKNGLTVGSLTIDATTSSINTTSAGATISKVNLQLITSNAGSMILSKGTTAERDSVPSSGYIRFNTDLNKFEGYNGTEWGTVGGDVDGGTF